MRQNRQYQNGESAAAAVSDHKYVVTSFCTVNGVIEIEQVEKSEPIMNWNGGSSTSFF